MRQSPSVATLSQDHGLQGYVNWHYLLGTRQELSPIWSSYHVAGVPPHPKMMSQSAMSHSSLVYVLDQQGRERVRLTVTLRPISLRTISVRCSKVVHEFDELMKKQPGIMFVSDIFQDPEKGTLMGFTFRESQEAFQAAWPVLAQNAPASEWEIGPPEVYMLNAVG